MTAIDVCYCVLILSGAFALVSLGILLLRSSTTVKQVGNTVEMAQSTINKADKIKAFCGNCLLDRCPKVWFHSP